jgi:hypothetical protein
MPITWIYIVPVAYLLVGCLLMLAANELLDGAVSRYELLLGMLLWPLFLGYFLEGMARELLTEVRRRIRG